MANNYYKIALAGIIALIVVGVVLAFEEYGSTIYPLDQSRGILVRIQATSDPQAISDDIKTVQQLLPKSGNPVWIFPTEDTDFGMMQQDLSTMSSTVEKISTTSPDTDRKSTRLNSSYMSISYAVFCLKKKKKKK